MAKEAEIEAIKAMLDKEWPEGTTADAVASAVLRAIDKTRETSMRGLGAPLRVGMAFKPYWSSKTHYVAWIGTPGPSGAESAWVVTADSDYGSITYVEHPFWRFTSPVEERGRTVRRRTRGEDGEWIKGEDGKDLYTVTEYDTPGSKVVGVNELGMKAGDKVTFRQDGQYSVEAIHAGGVLLRSRHTGFIWAETNGNLEKFYKDGWR